MKKMHIVDYKVNDHKYQGLRFRKVLTEETITGKLKVAAEISVAAFS